MHAPDYTQPMPPSSPPGPDALDLRGLKCPLPVLRTRKALRSLQAGEVLVVECTDPLSAVDIPHLVAQEGHALLHQGRAKSVLTFRIRKGG